MEKNAYYKAWRIEHREEIRVKRHVTYLANQEEIKAKRRVYVSTHKEQIAEHDRVYYAENSEEKKAYQRDYLASHQEERLAYCDAHREERNAQSCEYHRVYDVEHYEEKVARFAAYVIEHPEVLRRACAKHRLLGYVPLNAPFVGCEGHHIDKERVINMPKPLHHSVYHNQYTGQGMAQMNAIAYNFLFKQEVEAALEDKREQLA